MEDVTWKLSIGGILYWGSGDKNLATDAINMFDVLSPLGQAHWGQIDNLAGQNLLAHGVQASLKPDEKFTLVSQRHCFQQAPAPKVCYNVAAAAQPGTESPRLGNELDIVGTWTSRKASNLQAGYFWLVYGDAVTEGPPARPNAEPFDLQAT